MWDVGLDKGIDRVVGLERRGVWGLMKPMICSLIDDLGKPCIV